VPVQSGAALDFSQIESTLTYRAMLYELHDKAAPNNTANIVPNWFGVAIPNPDTFDLSSDVYVVLYFHPTPGQANYRDQDYPAKTGTQGGTDWKQLYAYVDRLGGQMTGAIQYGAPANRLVIFPFLTEVQYTLPTSEWLNVIHDILQDINANQIPGICTRPKKIVVATLSNGSVYLNKFLTEVSGHQNNNDIIEVWDFDSKFATTQVNPHGKHLRAYWQAPKDASIPNNADFVQLPASSWIKFPKPPLLPDETPPLPPNPSNSNTPNNDVIGGGHYHHHLIRDTMFLDAAWNLDNPNA
jgi:hypothetical protein